MILANRLPVKKTYVFQFVDAKAIPVNICPITSAALLELKTMLWVEHAMQVDELCKDGHSLQMVYPYHSVI